MFRKVMVANRGEIARRIIRTLNRMNIKSVAVFSEADKNAPYLDEATDAICIGPARAIESYLCQAAILQAALQTECEAIHPGFGFLSENAVFATRCQLQNLTFIGPSATMISLMGDKARARQTMAEYGVKTLVGSEGVVASVDEAMSIAQAIGFPLLLKARAGGGGKGMRLVENMGDLPRNFSEAQLEAQSGFGDKELYIERFVKNARHIEFQVLGDSYGNVVVLGERECSIQRKNQKLLEEAPANGLSDQLRNAAITRIAQVMKEIGYTNAGTLEFLLGDDELYFMEMNTRIQVEHPVTELVYGLDIVEWQTRIACGEKIPFLQRDIVPKGAAIECRINAEDPSRDFLPTPGVIKKLSLPQSNIAGPIRIDTHIAEGFSVSPFYDSMLAKVIVHGTTRKDAINLMKRALSEIAIGGVSTTLDFHKAILEHDEFADGRYDCSFIGRNFQKIRG